MNRIYTFFILFIGILSFAQTHRFIYQVNYRKDSTSVEKTKVDMYLDINPDESLYYKRSYYVDDSLRMISGDVVVSDLILTDILQKNRKTNEYSNYTFQGFDSFLLKDIPQQKWKIGSESRSIDGYKVQKATTKWAGRDWIAWFAPDIPFHEGPYKFHGLPGLIMEVNDTKDQFHFELIRSTKLDPTYVLHFYTIISTGGRAVSLPYSRYKQMKLDYYKSPMKAARDGMIDLEKTPITIDQNKVLRNEKDLRDYEESERALLVKYNNPIELDKIIVYPKK